MKIVCEDKILNISPYYMKPAYSFGGSCLPKDVRALSYRAASLDIDTPMLRSIMASNRTQLDRGFNLITSFNKRNIGLRGLSFKAGTDDLRESPLVDLAEKLIGKGYNLAIYDKNIELAKIKGSNKDYINLHIPHVSNLLNKSLDDVVAQSDVLVIGNGDQEFKQIVENPPKGKIIVDLFGLMNTASDDQKHGICW
jgi:GDP-mannose 6-dehydrogenase